MSRFDKSSTLSESAKMNNKLISKIIYKIRTFKVKSYFVLKCFSPLYLSANIVYRYNCLSDSCTDSYIGFTSRHLFVRCAEHLNTNLKQQSEIKDHVINCSACNSSTLCYKDF